jgi:hypothetical protein
VIKLQPEGGCQTLSSVLSSSSGRGRELGNVILRFPQWQTPSPKLIKENETAEVRTEDGQGVYTHSQNGSVPALDEAGDV